MSKPLIEDYQIAYGDTEGDLERRVMEFIYMKYEPIGGVTNTNNRGYLQAMIKRNPDLEWSDE